MSFEDFLRWHNINLKITNMPSYVNGFAYFNGNEYLVIINSRCSSYQQQEALIHEMVHIFENHFSCPAEYEKKCEQEAHMIVNKLKDIYIKERS